MRITLSILKIIVIIILLKLNLIHAQEIEWESRYGSLTTDEYGKVVVQCSDSGLAFLGRKIHPQLNTNDIYLIKTNKYGDTVWSKVYGLEQEEEIGNDIFVTNDGGFIICGETTQGEGGYDIYMLRCDSLGDSIWTKTNGGIYDDKGTAIIETYDGGFCLTGYYQPAYNVTRLFLSKIDDSGNEIWFSDYGENDSTARGYDLIQTRDSDIVVAGSIDTVGYGRLNSLIARYDKNGSLIWLQHFGDTSWVGSNSSFSVCRSPDDGFLLCGIEQLSTPANNLLLIKTNGYGDSLWSRLYGDSLDLVGMSIEATVNGRYIVAACSYNPSNMYIYYFDSLGDSLWTMQIDRGPDDNVKNVIQTYDGGFLLIGYILDSLNNNRDIFGIKIKSHLPRIRSFAIDNSNMFDHVTDHSPEFEWSIESPYEKIHDSILLEVDSDGNWSFIDMWSTGEISTEDTFIVYAGNTLIDGMVYYLRLKVAENDLWSPWYETSFRMNSVPSTPVPLHPVNNEIVDTDQPMLWIQNSTDAEDDTLTYDYFIVVDTAFSEPDPIYVYDYPEGGDSTGWQVSEPLHENWRYWWRARAHDGYEYSEWSELFYGELWVNVFEEVPSDFQANYPPDTGYTFVTDMLETFWWSESFDPDPLDSVYYRLHISIDSNFTFAQIIDSIWETEYTLVDSLEFGTRYWWKAEAIDNTGLSTFTWNTPDFKTWMLGDADGNYAVNILDITFLIAYLYKGGLPPYPIVMGDINGDCLVNILDITYLISYLYKGGLGPVVGCE